MLTLSYNHKTGAIVIEVCDMVAMFKEIVSKVMTGYETKSFRRKLKLLKTDCSALLKISKKEHKAQNYSRA